jgi:hypothetical protein
MKTPRRTETPAAPPGVCSACHCKPVRVVRFTDEQGQTARRASTSCADCQRGAFGGGSPAPVVAAEVTRPVSLVTEEAMTAARVTAEKECSCTEEDHPCLPCAARAFVVTQRHRCAVVEAPAPISETRAVPRPVVPLTADETVAVLAASVERVASPPSVTARDLERHAARMRKAGMAPVTRETCDPHERRFFSVGGGR